MSQTKHETYVYVTTWSTVDYTSVTSIIRRSWTQEYIFVSRTRVRSCSRAYDFAPENWIIGCRFSLWKYVDRI